MFGYPEYWVLYYIRDPERGHNFDNHPLIISQPGPPVEVYSFLEPLRRGTACHSETQLKYRPGWSRAVTASSLVCHGIGLMVLGADPLQHPVGAHPSRRKFGRSLGSWNCGRHDLRMISAFLTGTTWHARNKVYHHLGRQAMQACLCSTWAGISLNMMPQCSLM